MPEFTCPATIITGLGCLDQIGRQVARLGKTCLLVTGEKSMQDQGAFDRVLQLLGSQGVATTACTGVEHDPSLRTVDRARQALTRHGCDVVLGLGGGSAIDVAKAAAGLADESQPTRAFFDGLAISGRGRPVVAAPSTFGTGTEATRVAVLSDPERQLKKSIRHDCMLPRVAIVDPLIGVSAPPRLTAACGMDALCQAIESYLSVHATDLTRAMSFSATVLLVASLGRAFRDGQDVDAREGCANGSLMAGIALHNARLGLAHGLAHPLGIRYGLAHGEICGILLPHVLAYNRTAAGDHYRLLSGLLAADAADWCQGLLAELGLPADLRHVGIPREDFQAIAEEALASGSTMANPRQVVREDVLSLLEEIC